MSRTPLILSSSQLRRRSLALAVVLGPYVLSFFHRFAPAAIAPDVSADFSISAASMGILASTYFYVYTVMQVPTGILVDTIGSRRILLAGGLIGGIGSILFGLAPSFAWAVAGRTLIGLGVSVAFIAMLKIVAVWFDERRFASVAGLCILIGNSGSILAGAPLSLMAQSIGWRGIFVAVGLLSLVLGVACWVWVRDHPDDDSSGTSSHLPGFDRTVVLTGLLRVVRNPATWPCMIVATGIAGSFFTFGGLWGGTYLMQVHAMSRDAASGHLSLYFASFAAGSFLLGTLSDRIGRRKPVLIICTHVYALIWLLWLSGFPLAPPWSYALFVLMGVVTSCFTLTWVCAKELNPPLLSGMSTSVTNMGCFLGAAVMQPLVGWIMDLRWQGDLSGGVRIFTPADYRVSFSLLVVMAWIGAAASWRIRETGARNVWAEGAKLQEPE